MTISGHQLDKIIEIEIEIEPVAIERFIGRATYTEHLYALVIKLVKAIHHHHGQGTLRECQIADVSLNTPSGKKFLLILELGSLLPPLPALKTLSIESPRPLDRYLAKLKGLSLFFTMQWLRLSEHYDCDLIRILQCCRELTHLEISKGLEPRHANLFAWAAQEERDRAAGKWMLPAVPLENLQLSAGEMKEVDAMKIVRDALFAFARSLCQLEVNLVVERAYGDDDDDGDDDNWPSFAGLADSDSSLTLPNLTKLWFRARNPYLLYPRLLMGSRKLNWLALRQPSHPHSNSRVHSWPLTSHPHLTYLYLEGVPANAFDPRALANMPCLKDLTLKQALEDPTPERSLRMERWTWDWHLPVLQQLHVLCAIEGWFSLKILRTCPRLQKLALESMCKQMLEVGAVLDDSWPECECVVGNLTIGENWDITPTDLALLFNRVIPHVKYAELPKFDSCTQRQVVETTRDSRGLKDLKLLYGFLDSDDIKEVGLSMHPAFDVSRHDCRSVSIGGVKYYWRDSQSCPECRRMDKEEEEEKEEEEDEDEDDEEE
ncbi:hypothetical protein DFQ26_000502 [Actinomortierella ambigua]|nr:hypothetical protein DFQ26_000502 [Actinomortierella ambigua]